MVTLGLCWLGKRVGKQAAQRIIWLKERRQFLWSSRVFLKTLSLNCSLTAFAGSYYSYTITLRCFFPVNNHHSSSNIQALPLYFDRYVNTSTFSINIADLQAKMCWSMTIQHGKRIQSYGIATTFSTDNGPFSLVMQEEANVLAELNNIEKVATLAI